MKLIKIFLFTLFIHHVHALDFFDTIAENIGSIASTTLTSGTSGSFIKTISEANDNIHAMIEAVLPLHIMRSTFASMNPFTHQQAYINYGLLSAEEINFINIRKKVVTKNLQKFLALEIPLDEDEIVNIALCTSGGGYRAFIATLGFLQGLQEEGILGITQYMSALSGSAWALGTWISSNETLPVFIKNAQRNISMNKSTIKNKSLMSHITNPSDIIDIAASFVTKFVFDQPLTSTDLWGALVINNILQHKEDTQKYTLSSQRNALMNGQHIFPLYTAVVPLTEYHPISYEWYEFSPTTIRNISTNMYVNPWAFGRKFQQQNAIPLAGNNEYVFPPELPLSNYLGICGSAFTVNVKEIVRQMENAVDGLNPIQKYVFDNIIETDQQLLNVSGRRILPGKVSNPEFGTRSTTSKKSFITLVDAGVDFNLPLPPLLNPQRKIDIIIMFDASSDYAENAPALQAAEQYAHQHNAPFPHINYSAIASDEVSIFNEARTPMVMYIPFINTCLEQFCGTFNFAYSAKEFEYVLQTARQLVKRNIKKIKKAIVTKQLNKL